MAREAMISKSLSRGGLGLQFGKAGGGFLHLG
jgi:hypothetical protein